MVDSCDTILVEGVDALGKYYAKIFAESYPDSEEDIYTKVLGYLYY